MKYFSTDVKSYASKDIFGSYLLFWTFYASYIDTEYYFYDRFIDDSVLFYITTKKSKLVSYLILSVLKIFMDAVFDVN